MTPATGDPPRPPAVDHLIYGVPDLEGGRDRIEELLGVRPVPGGRHPDYGTRNALLGLGPETYLEVMAPDPDLPRPERGVLFGLDERETPGFVTWALRGEAIEERAAVAAAHGLALGPVEAGSREKPDGTVLTWKLTDPRALPLGGVVPFLIAWGETPHPAGTVPGAGELVGLRLEHPDPDAVRGGLAALGVEAPVTAGRRARIVATIRTPDGDVEIA
ncbi:MAG TPA: VOC family protein [Gemmatimonadota bacterium]|nr:VOC family protein [Gemmatimonadota bacterium]